MSARVQLLVLGVCALVVGGSILALRWATDSVADLDLQASAPEEAGRELDPAEVEWLSYAPDRTLVDPTTLRAALHRLHTQLDGVFPGEPTDATSPTVDRSYVPAGWNDSLSVNVLIGAEQVEALPAPADRCTYLRETADRLAALGWTLSISETAAIQTEYPLVSPGPQDLELTGESLLGSMTLYAPATGAYAVRYGVGRKHLDAGDAAPSAADPPATPCE